MRRGKRFTADGLCTTGVSHGDPGDGFAKVDGSVRNGERRIKRQRVEEECAIGLPWWGLPSPGFGVRSRTKASTTTTGSRKGGGESARTHTDTKALFLLSKAPVSPKFKSGCLKPFRRILSLFRDAGTASLGC